jgi:hypothetical protein
MMQPVSGLLEDDSLVSSEVRRVPINFRVARPTLRAPAQQGRSGDLAPEPRSVHGEVFGKKRPDDRIVLPAVAIGILADAMYRKMARLIGGQMPARLARCPM